MNKIAKNASWIIICRIVQSFCSLIIGSLTARYLGPANYGLIAYAASLTSFVTPIVFLGFGNILVRELIDYPEKEGESLGTAMRLSLFSAIICIAVIILFAGATNNGERETIIVCALYSINLILQVSGLVTYWFQAKLLSKYSSIISLCAYILVSVYKIYILATQKNIYWFVLTNSFDILIIGVATFYFYRRLGGRQLRYSKIRGKEMFERSKHYIVSSMMVTIFAQTDKIMLKSMMNETATGLYGAALTCATMTGFVFTAIIDSFRPTILEGKTINEDIFEYRLKMLYSIIIYLSLLQSGLIMLFAPLIIRILYGAAYSQANSGLRIIVWYSTFSYLGSVRNIWILANSQQKHLWKINLSGACANVILNAVLIPIIGINGAAIASLVTQFFTNVLIGYILKPIRPNNRIMIEACHPKYLFDAARKLRT